MATSSQNELARRLKHMHTPDRPLLLANVWDAPSAIIIAGLPRVQAIATASYAIAATQGVDDNDMTLEQNLEGIRNVRAGLVKANMAGHLPLTADLQDGYDDPAESVRKAMALGVVGCNLEDVNNRTGELRNSEDSADRIRKVSIAAAEAGIPDFVVNARTDVLGYGGNIESAIERGREFLRAGATTVFVWGVGKWDIKQTEVEEMVRAFDGRLAVQPGSIGVETLATLGVSRISVGPALWRKTMSVIAGQAAALNVAD